MQSNKTGVFPIGKKYYAYHDDKLILSTYNKRQAEIAIDKINGNYIEKRGRPALQNKENYAVPEKSKFHVNERFKFLENAISLVATGIQPSVIVSGKGGLGKSYTVKKTLLEYGIVDYSNVEHYDGIDRSNTFNIIKGYTTAKALYSTLYKNNGGILVIDDMDSALENDTSISILKSALDSYEDRNVMWNASTFNEKDNIPQKFNFDGAVIFITNKESKSIDQAIRSRSLIVDVSMTLDETIDRMRLIIDNASFLPEYDTQIKEDAISFINDYKHTAKELSLRSLITICKIRAAGNDDWKRMSEYILCE